MTTRSRYLDRKPFFVVKSSSSSDHLFPLQKTLEILVGSIHNAPTDEGTGRIKATATIKVRNTIATFVIDSQASGPHALPGMAHVALHRYLDHIQWIEQCTYAGSNYSAGDKFLQGTFRSASLLPNNNKNKKNL